MTYAQPQLTNDDPFGRLIVERAGEAVVWVALLGEHDMTTAPAVRDTLLELAADRVSIVVDLAAAQFIDSSIIHALYQTNEALTKEGCRLVLRLSTRAGINRVLEISGLLDAVPSTDSRETAIGLANPGEVAVPLPPSS